MKEKHEQKRNSKYLKPRKPQFKNTKEFIGFDIETDASDPNNPTILICIKNDTIEESFRDIDEFIAEINKHKYRNYHFVATNLSFDFWGVFQDYPENVKMVERNGRIYKLTYYQRGRNKHQVHFYDTLNYFPASVKKLGNVVGLPKLEHPDFFPNKPQNEHEWHLLTEYCYRDAHISAKFMQDIYMKWIKENNLIFKTTMASTALCDFQTNDLPFSLFVNNNDVLDIIFKAYYGGRTETFRRGYVEKVYCYDFNSLYPSCMKELMPNPNSAIHCKYVDKKMIDKYIGFTYVEGYQEKCFAPVLPVRHEGRLLFPCGNIKGYYSHIEIQKAIQNGFRLDKIGEGVIYTKTIDLFSSYVDRHFNKRLEYKKENNPLEVMEKLAMNSLYGKFGFHYQESSQYVQKDQPLDLSNYKDMSVTACDQFNYVVSKDNTEPCNYSFPELSAHITALARLKLYDKIKEHQHEIIYSDTDSIFITSTRLNEKHLGGMKLEDGYPTYDNLFIRSKFYKVGDKIKCKGVSNMSAEQLNATLDKQTIQQTRFVKYRTAFRSKILSTEDKRVNEIIEVNKLLNLEDTKRKWFQPFHDEYLQLSEPLELEIKE